LWRLWFSLLLADWVLPGVDEIAVVCIVGALSGIVHCGVTSVLLFLGFRRADNSPVRIALRCATAPGIAGTDPKARSI
jgi:hypothetical protein